RRRSTTDAGQGTERLGTRGGPVGRADPQQLTRITGDVGADAATNAAQVVLGRGGAAEPGARQPRRAEREGPGHVGRLVVAGRARQRAATALGGRQSAGRPAEPPAYGEEGESGLVLAGQHLEDGAGALDDLSEHLVGVGGFTHGRGGEAEELLAPLVPGDD